MDYFSPGCEDTRAAGGVPEVDRGTFTRGHDERGAGAESGAAEGDAGGEGLEDVEVLVA